MSNTVDQKVVEMRFDNGQFNSGIQGSMSFIDKLKQSLNFKGASKGFENLSSAANGVNMSGLSRGVEEVSLRFSALQVAAVTALANITNAAINTGTNMVKALTVDPIMQGFNEYETKMNSIQTIMSNTASKGTSMNEVTKVIDDLNVYADKTIYNFAEMTRNIGTFTAAGVALEPAAAAIKGIANLAAASGSSSMQASTAMYQLSQALSTGTVKLMDWNSVVNAGMGGELFQNALKETAKRHGVAIDEIIAKNGSFRDSLQEGWLSADILNETLNNFTVDGAKNYSRGMMEAGQWTQEQADAFVAQAVSMEDAATKVKTFTQLWDTLKEAAQSGWGKSWEIMIGDFDEAKELLTSISDVIGGMINNASDARNNLLEMWKVFGGRDILIDGLRIMFDDLMIVVKAVGDALKEVFPPVTYEHLMQFSIKIKELAYNMRLSDENAAKLKSVFAGLFAVVNIVVKVFSSLLGVIKPAGSILSNLAQLILDIAAAIGDWLVGLDKSFEGFKKVGDGADEMKQKISDAFKSASEHIKSSNLVDGLSKIGGMLSKVGSFLAGGLTTLITTMVQGLSNINFDAVVGALGAAGFGAIVAGIIKFVKNLSGPFESFKEIAESVVGVLDSVKDSLKAYQNQINAKILLTIAIAVGILAASLLVLSGIDGPKLAGSLMALVVAFTLLLGAFSIFQGIDPLAKGAIKSSAVMIILAVSVFILASAMKKLGELEWDQIARGLTGVIALMGALVGSMKLLSMIEDDIVKCSGTLILFAIALKIMASALTDLSTLTWEQLITGLVGLGGILAVIGIFCNNTKFTEGMIDTGAGLLLLAIGLKVIASAMSDMADIGIDGVLIGLIGLGGALGIMAGALRAMPKDMLFIGAGLLIAAIGVKILASAVSSLGGLTLDQTSIGLLALAESLGVLALALHLMTGTVSGSAALLLAAVAIAVLTPSLILLSGLSLEGVCIALLALGGALLIFGGAAALLTPVIPAMLLVAAAVLLLGIAAASLGAGLFLAGLGIQALAVGFGMLAGMTASGSKAVVDALTTIITGIVTLIPTVATALAEGIVAFAQVIVTGAPVIAAAITSVISSLLTSLATIIPQGVEVFFQFITAICESLATNLPIITQAFLTLILGILQVIATNIPLLIQAGVDIIVAFITGIASAVPQLVDAGFKAIITFINGLADAIRDNTQPMIDAVNNLFDAVVEAGKAVLMNSIGGFLDAGSAIMNSGFISGITGAIGNVVGAIGNVISSAYNAAKNGISQFFQVGADMIQGMIDGILGAVGGVIDAAAGAAKSAYEAAKNAVLSNSPSKRFMWLGEDCDEGMAIGFRNGAGMVANAAANVAKGSLNVMSKTISKIGTNILDGVDAQPTIRPVMDLSEIQNGVKEANSLWGSNSMNIATSARVTKVTQPSVLDVLDDVVSATVNKVVASINGSDNSSLTIEVPLYMDGKQVAKATAPHINNILGVRTGLAARGQA